MPRPSKGARLYKRRARFRNGKLVHQAVWIIKDGDRHIDTGCVASPSETKPPRKAEQALANYIALKYQPERRRRDIEDIDCGDVLSVYLTDVGEPGNQFEIEARIDASMNFGVARLYHKSAPGLAQPMSSIAAIGVAHGATSKPSCE